MIEMEKELFKLLYYLYFYSTFEKLKNRGGRGRGIYSTKRKKKNTKKKLKKKR